MPVQILTLKCWTAAVGRFIANAWIDVPTAECWRFEGSPSHESRLHICALSWCKKKKKTGAVESLFHLADQ